MEVVGLWSLSLLVGGFGFWRLRVRRVWALGLGFGRGCSGLRAGSGLRAQGNALSLGFGGDALLEMNILLYW